MENNALDNATGTVFVDYVRKARPKMRESSVDHHLREIVLKFAGIRPFETDQRFR